MSLPKIDGSTERYSDRAFEKQLTKTKIQLLGNAKATFISEILFSLEMIITKEIPTAGVNDKYLAVNPDFFLKQSQDQRIGLLAHEAFHVALKHILRGQGLCKIADDIEMSEREQDLYNAAADYVINNFLLAEGFSLPAGGLHDPKYNDWSTDQVYKDLLQEQQQTGGSGNRCTMPDLLAPSDDVKNKGKEVVDEQLNDILVRAAIKAKQQDPEGYGRIPGEIRIYIDNLIAPKLNWKVLLANFLSSYNDDDFSWKRPNRRYMPDYYLPTLHSPSLADITVAVDTSGSVTDNQFKSFISEIAAIHARLSPECIEVIDFDTEIRSIQNIKQYEDLTKLNFTGRGGTSLHDLFKYTNKNPPQILIVFSDLYCDLNIRATNYPVLWVVINNKEAKAPFGTLVHLELPT